MDKTGKREQTQDSKRDGVAASQRLKVNENRTEEMPAWLQDPCLAKAEVDNSGTQRQTEFMTESALETSEEKEGFTP